MSTDYVDLSHLLSVLSLPHAQLLQIYHNL